MKKLTKKYVCVLLTAVLLVSAFACPAGAVGKEFFDEFTIVTDGATAKADSNWGFVSGSTMSGHSNENKVPGNDQFTVENDEMRLDGAGPGKGALYSLKNWPAAAVKSAEFDFHVTKTSDISGSDQTCLSIVYYYEDDQNYRFVGLRQNGSGNLYVVKGKVEGGVHIAGTGGSLTPDAILPISSTSTPVSFVNAKKHVVVEYTSNTVVTVKLYEADATTSIGVPITITAAAGTNFVTNGKQYFGLARMQSGNEDPAPHYFDDVAVSFHGSSNANLSNLTISNGTLDTAFTPEKAHYRVDVADSVTSMAVTPTVADESATLEVNGAALTSGTESTPVSLAPGENLITIAVTAENGTVKTYSVLVNRIKSDSVIFDGFLGSKEQSNWGFIKGHGAVPGTDAFVTENGKMKLGSSGNSRDSFYSLKNWPVNQKLLSAEFEFGVNDQTHINGNDVNGLNIIYYYEDDDNFRFVTLRQTGSARSGNLYVAKGQVENGVFRVSNNNSDNYDTIRTGSITEVSNFSFLDTKRIAVDYTSDTVVTVTIYEAGATSPIYTFTITANESPDFVTDGKPYFGFIEMNIANTGYNARAHWFDNISVNFELPVIQKTMLERACDFLLNPGTFLDPVADADILAYLGLTDVEELDITHLLTIKEKTMEL